jgi:hypothetical protein
MLRKALSNINGKNKHTPNSSSVVSSHANLMKKRDKGSREIKQLQAINAKHKHGHHGYSHQSQSHTDSGGVSDVFNGSNDSQLYTSLTYIHANQVANTANAHKHQHQRAKQICEYIQTYCSSTDGRYMLMNVERLILQPQQVKDDEETTKHVLALLEKFEKLLQAAGIDHYEWVEFTASRNPNNFNFNYDGEGNEIPSSNHGKASTLMKLNVSQFMMELDRLCGDLHFDKFKEEDKQLLFHTIAKGNLATYLLTSGNVSNGAVDTVASADRTFSESYDSMDSSSTNAVAIVGKTRRRSRTLTNSVLSQVYVDHCNLDITFKKYHAHIMRIKILHAVYHQLVDISNFMRKMKVRLNSSSVSTAVVSMKDHLISKIGSKSFYELKGSKISMKLPEIERLVHQVIVQYDAYVQEHGVIVDVSNLVPIQDIIDGGCYDKGVDDPNGIFYQECPIPEPQPAPFFSFGSASESNRKKRRRSSISKSFMNAVTVLGSLVPNITLGQSFRQVFPTAAVIEEDETLSSGSIYQRLEEDKELGQHYDQDVPRVRTEGMKMGTDEDNTVQSFKNDSLDQVIPSRDTERMEVEDIDEAVIDADSHKSFGVNNDFVNHMNPEERKHFNHFLKGILEGDDHHDHHHRHERHVMSHQTSASHVMTSSAIEQHGYPPDDEQANMKDIRKRYRVLKVSSSTDEENGKEIVKRISDVVPFHDSKDNSHSSSQLSRENSGWLYLNWNGSLMTGFSDRYLNRSSGSLNSGLAMEAVEEGSSIHESSKPSQQVTPITNKNDASKKGSQQQNKLSSTSSSRTSSSVLQSFNMHVSRAKTALFNVKK